MENEKETLESDGDCLYCEGEGCIRCDARFLPKAEEA